MSVALIWVIILAMAVVISGLISLYVLGRITDLKKIIKEHGDLLSSTYDLINHQKKLFEDAHDFLEILSARTLNESIDVYAFLGAVKRQYGRGNFNVDGPDGLFAAKLFLETVNHKFWLNGETKLVSHLFEKHKQILKRPDEYIGVHDYWGESLGNIDISNKVKYHKIPLELMQRLDPEAAHKHGDYFRLVMSDGAVMPIPFTIRLENPESPVSAD